MNGTITILYQAYDNKANMPVGPIITAKHDAVPTRSFIEAVKDPKVFGTYAEDYELRAIGEQFENGEIDGYSKPRIVITGQHVRNQLIASNAGEVAKYE